MPPGEGSAFGAIPAKVHRTPAAFTGTRFVHEQPLASRVGTEFDSTWIGPGKQINGVPSNSSKHGRYGSLIPPSRQPAIRTELRH
jgi:hypothetical protein